MNSKKYFSVKFMVFILITSIFLLGVMSVDTVSVSGGIQKVDKNLKFIVVNGKKFLLSKDTKIVDQKGISLNIDYLKPNLPVTVEGVHGSDGHVANKIVVKSK